MKQSIRKKRKRSIEQMQGIEAEKRNEGLGRIFLLLAIILFVAIFIGVAAFILPPHTELASLREELAAKKEQVARAKDREEQARRHLAWMEDPEYAEQIARDSANQARADETIIRLEPAEPVDEPKPEAEAERR